jgi:hypothetical protein
MSIRTFFVNGKQVTLAVDQVNSDPGNAFIKFFSTFPGNEMYIESDPGLFRLIQNHLRGYDIFPILDGAVPGMNGETALRNLLKEAERYELNGLAAKIREFQKVQPLQPIPIQWKIIVRTINFTQWKRN